MPHARYKVKCALCKKTFDNDNKGPDCKRFHPNYTSRTVLWARKDFSFPILACQKDLTDVIDLEDVTMNSGGLRGPKGTMAPGPTYLVAERGPALRKPFELNHRKTFQYTLCVYFCHKLFF